MSKSFSFGHIELKVGSSPSPEAAQPRREVPFRILLIGDFSGRQSRGETGKPGDLAARKPISVDVDDFEAVMERLGASVRLQLGDDEDSLAELEFRELDDFHPDRIVGKLDVFARLRQLRRRLLNPATFAEAAAEIRGPRADAPPAEPPADPPTGEQQADAPTDGGLLDTLIHETKSRQSQPGGARGRDRWDRLVRGIVEPYLVPAADPEQDELVAGVDEATSEEMRRILHDPALQAVESAWRSVHFLLRRLEVGVDLQLWLWDVTRDELVADLLACDDLQDSATYRVLVEATVGSPDGHPLAVLAGLFTADGTVEDAEWLGRMAKLAAAAGAPFLAAADSRLVGCESLANTPDAREWKGLLDEDEQAAWEALRGLPEAEYLALAMPRFLLRLPYGKGTAPAEQFDFQEYGKSFEHESYLWGNPAVACATLLGQSFLQHGWNFRPGEVNRLESLPVHILRRDGESQCLPCAEVVLSNLAADRISEQGFTPLQSVRDRDAVVVFRFGSLSRRSPRLAGRWQ